METSGEEFEYVLHPGDTFPVGDETWQVTEVEFPDDVDWAVVVHRIE